MSDTDFCIRCGKTIGMWDKTCKYCGRNQFGDNNEHYPDEEKMRRAAKIFGVQMETKDVPQKQKEKYQGLTAEEQLITGIHPDDEMYRKTLEMEVLTKNYK